MKEDLKELVRILSQQEKRKEPARERLKAELRSMVNDVLEGIAMVEREAFCQQSGAVGNAYYPRALEGLFGRIEELWVPYTREGVSGPSFWSLTRGHPTSRRSWW